MLNFLADNIGSILVGLVLLLIVVLIVVHLRRNKKKGKHICGGNCAGCSGCPSAGMCHKTK